MHHSVNPSRSLGLFPVLAVSLVLGGCSPEGGRPADTPGGGSAPDAERIIKASTLLPPGQSGLVTVAGLAQGQLTGDPADYGEHLDDQRIPYWSFAFKDGTLGQKPGQATVPKDGVEIYYDDFGVPIIYGDTIRDVYYGMGYAAAQQRLFLMDAARRLGRGTLAALAGCGSVPDDIATRVQTYTEAEYLAQFERLSAAAQESVLGLVEGANAYISSLTLDAPNLPAEYVVLSALPEPLTVADVVAEGVLITRSVAAEGGNEFSNIKMLQGLQARYGEEEGLQRFLDLVWDDDPAAVTTVPVSEGTFSNQGTPADGREAAFREAAAWATSLPDTLWKGVGTGDSAEPCTEGLPLPVAQKSGVRKLSPKQAAAARQRVEDVLQSLRDFRIRHGSFALAVAGSKTRDGGGLLISEPQLGYSYPTQLWEVEVHGPGIHARGSTVPGLPAVGIGYTNEVAWGLTTGYSKTVDSFIETICSTAQQTAGTCLANQYFHAGEWKDMECRTESVAYRPDPQGLPVGPAIYSADYEVCRTLHGPIVARDDEAGLARSLAYFMWDRELDNIEGVQAWARATNAEEFIAATSKVSWNENVTYATRDGDIGFIHPGYYPLRHPRADQRFPTPGDGSRDWVGLVPFAQMPQVHNPAQGYVANWNNKPAVGWLDGEGLGSTSRPGGHNQRVTLLLDQLAVAQDMTVADLFTIERIAGTYDPRWRDYRPLLAEWFARRGDSLSEAERLAMLLVLDWDGLAYGPDIDLDDEEARDGPAATIFGAIVQSFREELFAELREITIDPDAPEGSQQRDVFHRMQGVGSHVFDHSVMDNLILRVLYPSFSGLSARVDYLDGRDPDELILTVLRNALSTLAATYGVPEPLVGPEVMLFQRVHPRSEINNLTGVVGPSTTMPYQDRGSWIHAWGSEKP